MLRGIRGAITVESNSKEDIWKAAQLLVTKILSANGMNFDDIGAIIFSSTNDLTAAFPTTGIRQLPGFNMVPLFDTQQTNIEDAMERCIRVLILADMDKKAVEIHHIYLGDAKQLRPDL